MRKPKILFYDIETTPCEGYFWSRWQQGPTAIKKEWKILSFAYKWQGDKEIKFIRAAKNGSDKALCKKLWNLFNRADIVIAHNAKKFDNKKVRARFIFHGMAPHAPFSVVDTLVVARRHFKFTSNKLDDLGEYLGLGKKVNTGGFDLWLGCMANDPKAWKLMKKYNKQDVKLLEGCYDKLKIWMDDHPNVSLVTNPNAVIRGCPYCGSKNYIKRGVRATHLSVKQKFQCKSCLGFFQKAAGLGLPRYIGK